MKTLITSLILAAITTAAHAQYENTQTNNEIVSVDLTAKTASYFRMQANNKTSGVGRILENYRKENRDGRNLDGGIADPITAEQFDLIKIESAVDQRARCERMDNGRFKCNAAYEKAKYLVHVKPRSCHNSGCDYFSPFFYTVEMTTVQTCFGDHPYEDGAKFKCTTVTTGTEFS